MVTGSVTITAFDRWVADNNIAASYEYGKGWWDYVELVRRFADRIDAHDVTVVGHYVVQTPPPQERLPMPAVALRTAAVTIALKQDFGRMRCWPLEWTVSVQRRSPYRGPLFGLFDPGVDLRPHGAPGLEPDFLFGSYLDDPSSFSCEVADEWDVATLLTLVCHEA